MMSVALVLYPPEAIELPRMLSADAKHHRNLAVVIIENHGAFGAVQSVRCRMQGSPQARYQGWKAILGDNRQPPIIARDRDSP